MVVELRKDKDFEQLLDRSKTDPVLIFKHSTQCPISSEAYEEFARFARTAGEVPCGLVLVIEHREVSDTVAARLGVQHKSPQAILVKDGQPAWSASHWSITKDSLNEALKDHAKSPDQ